MIITAVTSVRATFNMACILKASWLRREAARARKVLEVDGEGGGWAGRARGPGTPDGGAAAGRPSGLDSIAAVLDEASPFPVNMKKSAARRTNEELAYYNSDEEVCAVFVQNNAVVCTSLD